MSSAIYIPLVTVLSHPGQFELKAALNVDTNSAHAEILEDDTDWDYVRSCIEPVLLCKFGARPGWHQVQVFGQQLYISCGVTYFKWLCSWLNENNYKYSTLVDSDHQTHNQR